MSNGLSFLWVEKRNKLKILILDSENQIKLQLPLTFSTEAEISKLILMINKEIFDYNLSVPVVRLQ